MEDKEKKLALQKAVGERVYHSRKLARMSKEELAERLGISSQYVNDIEQGKKCMSMAIFVELGEVFHTGLDELAHGAQKEEPVLEHLLCHLRQLLRLLLRLPVGAQMVQKLHQQAVTLGLIA